MPSRVRQIALPPDARALTTLPRVDYDDAFLVEGAEGLTGEQWARAMLEDAPAAARRVLRSLWLALGVQLGSTRDPRLVFGWEVRHSGTDYALLATHSRFGLAAELLFRPERQTLLFATFVHKQNALGRLAWPGVERLHLPAVRSLLEQARRRVTAR